MGGAGGGGKHNNDDFGVNGPDDAGGSDGKSNNEDVLSVFDIDAVGGFSEKINWSRPCHRSRTQRPSSDTLIPAC